MDANGDQEITADEFAAAMSRTIGDRPRFDTAVRTAALSLIQVADRDRNGMLDAAEYTQLTAVYGASPRAGRAGLQPARPGPQWFPGPPGTHPRDHRVLRQPGKSPPRSTSPSAAFNPFRPLTLSTVLSPREATEVLDED